MDIRMPRMDGIEATTVLLAGDDPRPRVLALTTFDLDEYVYQAVRAGASGFLLKDVSPDGLVHAVQAVARGDTLLASAVTRRLLERFRARRWTACFRPSWSGCRSGNSRWPAWSRGGCRTPTSAGSCFSARRR